MKLARTHLGSLAFILAILGGTLAAACSAPPAGSIGAGDQEQNANDDDDDGTASSTSPTNPSNTNNQPSTPGTGTGTSPTPPAPPGVDASAPPDPPPSAGTCSATPDMWACFDCCDAAHPGGWEVAAQAFDTCVCTQACAAACGSTYCAGGEPSDACIQCLDNEAQQCEADADAACTANASCAAADACAQASQCETKPEQ